jgi:hypothetical protein
MVGLDVRRMFSGWGFYCRGLLFAAAWDGEFRFRSRQGGRWIYQAVDRDLLHNPGGLLRSARDVLAELETQPLARPRKNRVAPEGRSSQPRMGGGQFALASADDLRRRFDARLARSARHVISRRPCRPGQCLWWGTTMFVTRTRRVPLLGFLAFGRDELLRQRRLLSMNGCRRCSPGRSAQSPGCWAWPRSRPSPSHTPTRNPRRPTRPTRHRHGPGTSGSAGVSRASAVTSMAMVSTGESPRAAIPVAQVRPALPGRRKRPGCEEPHEEQAHLLPAPRRWIDRNQI